MRNSTRNTSEKNVSVSETVLLDASAWIEYLRGTVRGRRVAEHIDGKQVAVSAFTVFEVASVLGREGEKIDSVVRVLLDRAIVHHVSSETAANAAQFYVVSREKRPKLSGGDALTYATADELGFPLLTCDNDFAGLPRVTVIR